MHVRFAKNLSRQRLPWLYGRPGSPAQYERGTAAGRWVTIGAVEGEDGKKHGGTPIHIEDGRITKGHRSLTGRKIAALKEEPGATSRRKELHQSKG